jgi:hypothetical protein
MKKIILSIYGLAILGAFMLQSCEDGPIVPNGGANNNVDTTWVGDTLGDPNGGGQIDSTDWNGGGDPIDSTGWNGNGGSNPGDSLGGN